LVGVVCVTRCPAEGPCQTGRALHPLSGFAAELFAGIAHDQDVHLCAQSLCRAPCAPHHALSRPLKLCQREQPLGDWSRLRLTKEALLADVEVVTDQPLSLDFLGYLAQCDFPQGL